MNAPDNIVIPFRVPHFSEARVFTILNCLKQWGDQAPAKSEIRAAMAYAWIADPEKGMARLEFDEAFKLAIQRGLILRLGGHRIGFYITIRGCDSVTRDLERRTFMNCRTLREVYRRRLWPSPPEHGVLSAA